jgi:hypothetical protein
LVVMVVVLGSGGRRATATTTGHSEMRGSGPQDSVRSWGASH